MNVHDFIRENREVLEVMLRNDIRPEDAARLALYNDYLSLVAEDGAKMGWVLAVLSERWGIGWRQILRIVQKFKRRVS